MERPWLYDSHVHLSDPHYAEDMPQTLLGMERMGIIACCVSTNEADSEATLRLAESSGLVLPFVGVHPEFAESADMERVEGMLAARGAAGIGEIGLDPTYGGDPGRQADVFEAQLGLAERMDLPVSVHSRKSLDAVLDTLSSFRCRALLHWFEGSKGRLRRAMDAGLYVSYGPLAVYAADKRRLLSLSRPDRVLVETDGPVPFGRCFGNMCATPAFLPSVAHCAAGALGMSDGDTLLALERNARSYLRPRGG